jgi:hypothetical protein
MEEFMRGLSALVLGFCLMSMYLLALHHLSH